MATNELPNPGFETDISNWNTSQFTLSRVVSANAHAGTAHGKLVSTGAATRILNQTPRVNTTPGELFSASAMLRWESGTPKECGVQVQFFNSAGTQIGSPPVGLITPDTGSWQRSAIEGQVAPSGAATARFSFRMTSAVANDTVWIDSAGLFRSATLEEPVATGYFFMWDGTQEIVLSDPFVRNSDGSTTPVTLEKY